MKVAVLLLFALCASAQDANTSQGPQDKPGYEQTEAPDKQVEYVTGPNVGIVGPTVLGGKGQEVQPSGEELQATDKEQRDVSEYSGYRDLSGNQETKGQSDAAAYAKYAASLTYNGMKYLQEQQGQYRKGGQKKHPVVKVANRPAVQKVTYYQSEEPGKYPQNAPQQSYYETQNQDQNIAQLHAHIHAHQLNQSPVRGSQDYQQGAAQPSSTNHGQEERRVSESQTAKSQASSVPQGEEHEGQQTPPTNDTPVYIPQEYLQYHLAQAGQEAQIGDLQSALQFPGKYQLQLFLPQEGSGPVSVQEQPQVTPVQHTPHVQPIPNNRHIQYIPSYITSQSPATIQRERHPTVPQQPTVQIIRQPHQPLKQYGQAPHNAYSSSNNNPSIYQRAQPQLHSNFQPSQQSPFNEIAQYHHVQQPNVVRRPQTVYLQPKQSAQPIQLADKALPPKQNPSSHPISYRPKSPERLPQGQPEHLALISQSPPKTTQHRQTHDKPPTHQSEQVYQPETQTTDDKLGPNLQTPYSQNIQKLQAPLHIQNPTPFPLKAIQPQLHIPLTHTYELPSDKVALRPFLYPIPTQVRQVQTEIPHQALGLIPAETDKLYSDKFPHYLKAFETKPFGFSQMSFGQQPGSYSYSIFNKHS